VKCPTSLLYGITCPAGLTTLPQSLLCLQNGCTSANNLGCYEAEQLKHAAIGGRADCWSWYW